MTVTGKHISVEFNESALRERNSELAVLLEMSNFLSGTSSRKEILEGALSLVMANFEFHAGRIYLKEENQESLRLAAYRGLEPLGLERVKIGEGFTGKSAETKSFLAQPVTDLINKERARLLQSKGFMVAVCVPMIVGEEVVGVMNLNSKQMVTLDQNQIDLLITLANAIAINADRLRLYEDLQKKIQELEEKNATLKFFSYSISHDLKNPAISIHGLTSRLCRLYKSQLDDKGQAYCNLILSLSEQVIALLDEMNAYIKAKESPLAVEKVETKDIIELIRGEFASALEQRGIKLTVSDLLPRISADKLSLTRIFRNFVDNSLKYGGACLTEIQITYQEDRDYHMFSINDNGVGISAAAQEKICEPFQRDETSRGIDGIGLGLAIVKELTRRHGGTVSVESAPGKGVRFSITIAKSI
ncbi:MAG: GAF domain-containing sensor histidine kinase [Deltaproteobacteria bacterium]|nr:GAF domain-containing sensor histidine kinase [Deltaproteobacteria bacterium]